MGINKESQRAVEGVREKIQKKFFSDKLQVSMTETDSDIDERAKSALKLGEEYTDKNGTVWYRMESGGITNKRKMEFLGVPMFCPKKECGRIMGGPESKQNSACYMRFGYCYDCRLKFEKKLKLSGKWADYVKKTTLENEKAKLRDLEQSYEEWLMQEEDVQKYIMNSSGELETWFKDKNMTEKQQKQAKQFIDKLKEKVNKQK